ncbi:hypothetical protein FOMG_19260 [Fusarium oxysporum f. sp. melonis 26406]|uniref:LysM domain-containing protein n=1 Tax=Fusarium oxysporum f. sp. melonis 26406 TaxID=1089452 RepID=W9Z5W6_FUSOX|nr:hypothetical protein FOMG_19260 [Fusarium oxysporum f. sp. melonis 26406]
MRFDTVFVLTSLLGVSDALRRQCKHNPANEGEGWYYTTSIDNADNVAADFCTKPSIIRQWNNIKGNENVRPGKNLKVPCRQRRRDCKKGSGSTGWYTVESGDWLSKIAPDFCTDVRGLLELNPKLKPNPDYIEPGWIVTVPCSWN